MKNNSVRRLVIIALMVALSYVLMFWGVPVVPAAPFLKIELSFLPIIVLALGVDVKSALLASFIVNMMDFFFKGSMTGLPIDQMANFLAVTFFLTTMVYFVKKEKVVLGLITAVVVNMLFMTTLNYFVITPWYFSLAGWDMPENLLLYCVQIYGVFNLIKWGLVAVVYKLTTPWIATFRQRVFTMTH
ncbi:MAG: ECF transporter S component [Erysipelotrichaceae bacterium]